MADEILQTKSELELKYKGALDAIAGGSSWEKVVVDSVLDKKPGRIRRFLTFMGDNLAVITSLIVAIAGITFGILQFRTATTQKDREISQKASETKIARVQALQQLIPSLTSEKADVRRYGLAALVTLYPSATDQNSDDNKELSSIIGTIWEVGDAETIEVFATTLNDAKLKKKAAELYAIRSEQLRHQKAGAQTDEAKLFKSASADANKALALDSENARAIYQIARIKQDAGELEYAFKGFDQVLRLVEEGKYPRDDEIYLRSFLQKVVILHEQEKEFSKTVCSAYQDAKTHYLEAGLDINWDEEAVVFKSKCK
jgi:hypothetical protein